MLDINSVSQAVGQMIQHGAGHKKLMGVNVDGREEGGTCSHTLTQAREARSDSSDSYSVLAAAAAPLFGKALFATQHLKT